MTEAIFEEAEQKIKAIEFFKNKLVTHSEVKNFLKSN